MPHQEIRIFVQPAVQAEGRHAKQAGEVHSACDCDVCVCVCHGRTHMCFLLSCVHPLQCTPAHEAHHISSHTYNHTLTHLLCWHSMISAAALMFLMRAHTACFFAASTKSVLLSRILSANAICWTAVQGSHTGSTHSSVSVSECG